MNSQATNTQNTQEKAKPKQQQQQSNWSKLVNKILRPPRSEYKQSSLGKRQIMLNQIKYERQDHSIDHNGKQLKLTLYQPEHINNWIILFLHANSSSKLQCTTIIKFLPPQFSLASFDFIGCGLSPYKQNISLGVRESQQVKTVVSYLRQKKWEVVLWGRSMGAASALKYAQTNRQQGKVPIIVADSSFSSFQRLCQQQIEQNSPQYIPKCLLWCLFPCLFCKLRSDIRLKGSYNIDQLNIIKNINKISKQTMIIFITGDQDTLINQKHSQRLFNSFQGQEKKIQIFNGSHNSKRPEQTIKKVMGYIMQKAKKLQSKKKIEQELKQLQKQQQRLTQKLKQMESQKQIQIFRQKDRIIKSNQQIEPAIDNLDININIEANIQNSNSDQFKKQQK